MSDDDDDIEEIPVKVAKVSPKVSDGLKATARKSVKASPAKVSPEKPKETVKPVDRVLAADEAKMADDVSKDSDNSSDSIVELVTI
jgi:CRISPR/Cas system-associated protein Csm6